MARPSSLPSPGRTLRNLKAIRSCNVLSLIPKLDKALPRQFRHSLSPSHSTFHALDACQIDSSLRAEQIPPAQYLRLANELTG